MNDKNSLDLLTSKTTMSQAGINANVTQTLPAEHRTTNAYTYRQLINDTDLWYLNVYVNALCCGLISIFGTCNNLINMVIFFQLGLKDSMGVCLFFLALSDFLLSFVVMTSRVFPIWASFFPTEMLNPMDIWHVGFDWVANSLFLCSGLITTFLALERCVCVTFPFKVKLIFTRNRSFFAVSLIYVSSAVMYVPIYTSHWLEWVNLEVHDIMANVTPTTTVTTTVKRRLVLMLSENRPQIVLYVDILSGNILPFTCLFLILGSVFWMVYGLQKSSKLRSEMTAISGNSGTRVHANTNNAIPGKGVQDRGMNSKTRRLVKVVLFLAIIFSACAVPRLFATHMYLFNHEVNQHGRESNMYTFQWHFFAFGAVINASLNIFVYLIVNSSYRAKFKQIFKCKQ